MGRKPKEPKPTKADKQLESQVQASILQWLNLIPGVYAWRRNVGGMKKVYNGKASFVRFGRVGQSDIEGIGPGGVHIEIEVKRPGKTPSDEQMEWLSMIRSREGIAFWADSLDSCVRQLRDEFQRRSLPWSQRWEC